MIKNILITGSGGFIGQNIKTSLAESKYNLFYPRSYELNLLDKVAVKKFIKNNEINFIIHSASCGVNQASNNLTKNIVDENILMFKNLSMNLNDKIYMLNFGSGAEYDKTKNLNKIKEQDFSLYIPKDSYGYSKYVISKEIEKLDNVVNLRLFGVYGKYEDYTQRFISQAIIKNLLKQPIDINQNVYFDYLYINDFNNIVQKFIQNKAKEKMYNITPNKSIDLISIAKLINEISDFQSEIVIKKLGLNNEYTGCNNKLLNEFDNITFTNYFSAIQIIYNYYKQNLTKLNLEKFDLRNDTDKG